MTPETVRLLIDCPDARGVVASVASFVAEHRGNVLDSDQHSDPDEHRFFMRMEIERRGFGPDRAAFVEGFEPIARRFSMDWRLHWGHAPKRVVVLVSRETHCVSDLLWRVGTGELHARVPLVISNHEDARPIVESLGVEFRCLPVTPRTRAEQEARVAALLAETAPDLIVLARYMQILSPGLVHAHADRIINIHHSFLPAFAGARPYHQAFERGVKIIGATSHYVTEQLDEGPIIAQGTAPISHRDTVETLVRKGRDLERVILADAVRAHLEDRVIVTGNKTVVFG